ncbi:MAG: hypothetical protein WAV26_03430 [Candidatus Deferrimicrobium sp.]
MKGRKATGSSVDALMRELTTLTARLAKAENTIIALRAAAGFLFVDFSIPLLFPGTASFAVAPVSEDEAVIRGFGHGMGETIRSLSTGGEEMLSYSGYLFRKKRS